MMDSLARDLTPDIRSKPVGTVPSVPVLVDILERINGREHPDTAQSLNNLALLYQAMGDYAKAEPLLRRAMAIEEKALGAEHPSTVTSLNNLAELYRAMGALPKPNRSTGAHWRFARRRWVRSIPIRPPALGTLLG